MRISLPLARSLAGRFARAAAATALAATALLTVAALVEGHAPRLETLRAVVAPLAAVLGACWALGGWRRAGEDIAAAALGWRVGLASSFMGLLALPLLALGPHGTSRAPDLTITAEQIVARLPEGPVSWRWTATGVERESARGVEPMPTLPPPRPTTAQTGPRGPWPAAGLRLLALLLGLLGVTAGAAPGPPRVLAAATAAFAAGHGAVWLLG